MKRLTKYKPRNSMYPYILKDNELITELDCIHKLGMLEDIEEELGIDLNVLFKALKNGVCYLANQNQLTKDYVSLFDNYISIGPRNKLYFSFITYSERRILLFENYGITWFLNAEEPKNEK